MLYTLDQGLLPADALLWLYFINDAKSSTTYAPPPRQQQATRGASGRLQWAAYSVLRWPFLLKPLAKATLAPRASAERPTTWDDHYTSYLQSYSPASRTRQNEALYLADVIQWSATHRLKLLVAVAPTLEQFSDGHREPQAFVAEVMHAVGVPTLDLLPALRAANERAPVFLRSDNAHWSDWGHRAAATAIENWLEDAWIAAD
ncbi:MAG: hypothetical protein HY675_05370 [Chloroflexi bacterium]|nr:hypothetical protein [Chloroflexota bacterium]